MDGLPVVEEGLQVDVRVVGAAGGVVQFGDGCEEGRLAEDVFVEPAVLDGDDVEEQILDAVEFGAGDHGLGERRGRRGFECGPEVMAGAEEVGVDFGNVHWRSVWERIGHGGHCQF